jgi:hypothetical protein
MGIIVSDSSMKSMSSTAMFVNVMGNAQADHGSLLHDLCIHMSGKVDMLQQVARVTLAHVHNLL